MTAVHVDPFPAPVEPYAGDRMGNHYMTDWARTGISRQLRAVDEATAVMRSSCDRPDAYAAASREVDLLLADLVGTVRFYVASD